MSLMMCEGKYVGRDEIANVPTPEGTDSWHPVPHMDVIDAVTEVVKAHNWQILDEQYGLAREGQRMFGVMRINNSSSREWSRCIGIRNSHDQSLSVGLAAGISVMCCSNLAFGGTIDDVGVNFSHSDRNLGGGRRFSTQQPFRRWRLHRQKL